MGSLELKKGLKWCPSRAKSWPGKGDLEDGTYPYYLPMWVNPPTPTEDLYYPCFSYTGFILTKCCLQYWVLDCVRYFDAHAKLQPLKQSVYRQPQNPVFSTHWVAKLPGYHFVIDRDASQSHSKKPETDGKNLKKCMNLNQNSQKCAENK